VYGWRQNRQDHGGNILSNRYDEVATFVLYCHWWL